MPLREVSSNVLKKDRSWNYRFLQDHRSGITLHIWQGLDDAVIYKYQISDRRHMIEWKSELLRYGRVDEGENPMGIKQSPVVAMTDNPPAETVKMFRNYLNRQLNEGRNIEGLEFVISSLEKGAEADAD